MTSLYHSLGNGCKPPIVYLLESAHVLHELLQSKLDEFSDRSQTVLLEIVAIPQQTGTLFQQNTV